MIILLTIDIIAQGLAGIIDDHDRYRRIRTSFSGIRVTWGLIILYLD